MLELLKRNLFFIICGVVAVGSIALGAMGLSAMSQVRSELSSVASLYSKFNTLTRGAVNAESIAAKRSEIEAIQTNHKAVVTGAHTLNRYQPLASPTGLVYFPKPTLDAKLEFRQEYKKQFPALLERLKAGSPPTPNEIGLLRQEMEEEAQAQNDLGEDEEERDTPDEVSEPQSHPSGLITAAEARKSAETRAAIRKAQNIYCYANRASFQQHAAIDRGLSPQPATMWDAQISLWIQQDVVESLARLNEEAAAVLNAEGERPWVGNLPVKEVIGLSVSGYITSQLEQTPRKSLGGEDGIFTKNEGNELYDVVHFTTILVVDARDIPAVINAISKDKFHTPLNLRYDYDAKNLVSLKMEDKIYGPEPVVRLVVDFETVFFGDVYRRLMPDSILGELGHSRPEDEDDES